MQENIIKEETTKFTSNNNLSEKIIEKINLYEKKDISIISKSFESTISEFLSFLIDENNLAIFKIKIIKFLQSLFIKNEMNSEIVSRNCIIHENKLDIYKIIIHEYIVYKNNSNFPEDETSYRRELLVLIDILMAQITFERESYHYILSFLISYLNEKNGNGDCGQVLNVNSEILNRILILLQKYYHPFDISKFYGNFFFFNGESESSITIPNKINNKDNKKLLNLEDKLCILLFIKVFQSEETKSSDNKNNISILNLKLAEKNKESDISVGTDSENNLITNISNKPIAKLLEKETNCILIKIKKKKKIVIKLYLNGKKIYKEKSIEKEKVEIKELILFQNFTGIFYNCMIFKNSCPKYILNALKFETKENSNDKKENIDKLNQKSIYYNGFNSEELILPFLKLELKEEKEKNTVKDSSEKDNNFSINSNDYKEFKEKAISIYIPSRVTIPIAYEKNNLLNTPSLILEDSINELNAELLTNSPTINGVHIYKKIKNDFNQIGGLNNLLPIMELMVNNGELLSKENLEKFFDILIAIFSPYYKNALINEVNNNFFLYLSYFMEKIPSNFYDNNITNIFKKISSFFAENICEENYILNKQYQDHILMNEQILFKFHYKEQNEIIESMSHFIQNTKTGRKKHLSLDIFKIIKILLHLDEKKNQLFCCKNHADFFIENKGIMEPELYVRLNPIKELLTHLFKEYKKYCMDQKDLAKEEGKELFQIITMLTIDISPCLQKMIINLFTECLEINYDLYIDNLDQDEDLLNILLYAYKNSILDIKEDALKLIFLILKNKSNKDSPTFEAKFQFIINHILPYYLFQDEEIIKNTISYKNQIGKEISENEEGKIDDNAQKEENNQSNDNKEKEKEIHKKEDENKNEEGKLDNEKEENTLVNEIYGDTDNGESKKQINSIKIQGIINGVKYSLPIFNENLEKIHSLYNKKKLKILIYNLYSIVNKYFSEGIFIKLCLNLLIKIVSKGDLFLICSFLDILSTEEFENPVNKNIFNEELKNNQNLLQWLIETSFKANLIKEANFDKQKLFPGFDIDTIIENGNEIIIDDHEKKEKINQIITISKKLLLKIVVQNIYKSDFLFTWGKYYYELRNQENNFKSVRDLIFSFIPEIIFPYLTDLVNLEKSNFSEKRMCLYAFNLLFEFSTFYKLKQEDLERYQDEKSIFQELSMNLKYILISKMDDYSRDSLRPIDIQETIYSKFDEYPLFKTVFDKCTPLWISRDKDIREENEIYSQYIKGKKNIDIKELELMFYNFSDLTEFKEEKNGNVYVNKGIPLIFIFYHFFTLILTIGGTIAELQEIFNHLRLFIILLIISSSTLTSQGTGKKKKWPSEEEYEEVQNNIESIFLNLIDFFINKIKNIKEKIIEYNERSQELDSSEQKNLEYLRSLYSFFIKNLGYFLKVLNHIYREKKKEEENYKPGFSSFFHGIKTMFSDSDEIRKSGGYKIMEKLYLECSNLTENKEQNNYLDKITELEINIFFVKNKEKLGKKYNEEEIYKQLEENISNLLDDTEFLHFFEVHAEENKKILFPFVSYISARRDAIKNIIPIYDNRPNISTYPNNYYLVPDYIPESSLDPILIANIHPLSERLTTNINLDLKTCELERHYKSHNYKKEKQRLFSFRGIWSTYDFFYNKEKYKLKYRLLNHLSEDYTRVLLTPIMDVNYYLPQFGKFNEKDLFRNINSYKQITKATDLSFDIHKLQPELQNSKEKKHSQNQNKNTINPEESKPIGDTPESNIPSKSNEEETPKKDEDKNALYYIGKEALSCIKEEKKNDIHTHLFIEYIYKKHSLDQEYCLQANACFIKIGFHIRGFILNNSKGIGFYSFEYKIINDDEDDSYDADRKACFGSVFHSQNYKYNNFFIWIPYHKIQMVLKRRYFFRRQAIEIFTEDRKSFLFKLDSSKIQFFIDNIKFHMKQDIEDISIAYNKYDEKIGFVNKSNIFLELNMNFVANDKKFMNLKRIYEKWSKWEMSTLKLLMMLNIYGNRSYNDINQYPVFPWIITDYVSESLPNFDKKDFIRQMYKPMGMMDFTEESKERKENYELHWLEDEKDPDRDENYDRYGSHYSTSLYLTYYLVRVFPFSYIRIELQGKKFDDPNRLFNSLPNSFDCAISQKSDLRELIPEFFCFPEMFLNMNDLNLGEIADTNGKMKLVRGVLMPLWAKKDPYYFIEKHRELLESAEINEKINEWFNIIFGSKQKGKEGKKIKNLFIKQTYEDFEETYIKSNKTDRIYRCRMVEFGVTPNQIFKNDTTKRQNLNENQKIKRSILFNIIQKMKKNQTLTGNELIIEEKKISAKENIHKFFVFLVKKKDVKKERIFLLIKNKIGVYTKDKPQIFKSSTQKEKPKDKKIGKEKEENNIDFNIGEILVESQIKVDHEKTEDILNPLNNQNNTQEPDTESESKNTAKSKNKNLRFKYDRKFKVPKYRMNTIGSETTLYQEGSIIALGGFWNGDIIIEKLDDNQKVKPKNINIVKTGELSPIKKIIIDKTETFAICVNLEGSIFFYLINAKNRLLWSLHKKINEGQGEVASMQVNENLGIFIVCFKNGYNMVYTLPNFKLINSFRIAENELNNNNMNEENNDINKDISKSNSNNIYAPNIVFISNSPLPSFIFYIKERKSLCVYSINAHFLKEHKLGYEIVNNGIIKYTDYSCRDFLFIYNPINYTIDIHKLIDFKLIISSPVINYQFIDFHFSAEFDSVYILTNDKSSGNKMLIIKAS